MNASAQSTSGFSPIYKAVFGGSLEIVKLLIDSGNADVSFVSGEGFNLLYVAAQNKEPEICSYLVDKGVDVNKPSKGISPLYKAATTGDIDTCQVLV